MDHGGPEMECTYFLNLQFFCVADVADTLFADICNCITCYFCFFSQNVSLAICRGASFYDISKPAVIH